jgi:hypothetical protein
MVDFSKTWKGERDKRRGTAQALHLNIKPLVVVKNSFTMK